MMTKTNKKKKWKTQSQDTQPNPLPPQKTHLISRLSSTLLVLIPFTLFYIGIYNYIFDCKLDLNGDNADYYILGKALATGKGFRNISEPEQPLATHFPPGYPFIIATILKISPDNIVAVKVMNGVFFYGSLVLLFFLLKKFCGTTIWIPATTVMIVASNAHLLRFSTIMMSEIPFLFFSILSLFFFQKIDFSKNVLKIPQFYLLLACVIFSYYIKTLGLALMSGILLYLLFRKNFKSMMLVLTGFILGIMPWFIRGQRLGGDSYLYQLFQINVYRPELGNAGIADFASRFFYNITRYITREIPHGLFPSIPVDYNKNYLAHEWIAGFLLLAIIIYGIKSLNTNRTLIICYFIGTFGVLLLWPAVWWGIRFVLFLVPLLSFFFVKGLYSFLQLIAARYCKIANVRPAVFFITLFILIFFCHFPSLQERHNWATGPYPTGWYNYFQIAKWVKNNTPKNTLVCCRKPSLFYMYAERRAASYKFLGDDKALIEDLRQRKFDYVVVADLNFSSEKLYLIPAVQKNEEYFTRVAYFKNPPTYLFKFNR